MSAIGLANGIEWMTEHGSSLTMNWDEDTRCWEVEWITSGTRFRGVSGDLENALFAARMKAQADLEQKARAT